MHRDNAFLTDLETHLHALRLRIEEFGALAGHMNGDREAEHSKWSRELQSKLRTVEDKIARLKTVDDDALWEEIKLGAQVAWNDLNETYLAALTVFK